MPFWKKPQDQQQPVLKEQADIKALFSRWGGLEGHLDEAESALELLEMEEDAGLLAEVATNLEDASNILAAFELEHLLGGQHDKSGAILSINSGAGGTESMDWASMLLRMYQRFAEINGYSVSLLDYQGGEEAGIKSATLEVIGQYAYGKLKAEIGVHRLVRISPFDSNKRRHTSFASVAVYPDLDDEIEIEIEEKDLRVDTYRASGAGGQHVNKTESAIRITHQPTGIVVQCQNERSQHKNRATAMKMLKAQLYALEEQKRQDEAAADQATKSKIEWGSQIRSYVMHPYQMVKDHRTNYETAAVNKVMDGELTRFIESALSWMAGEDKALDT